MTEHYSSDEDEICLDTSAPKSRGETSRRAKSSCRHSTRRCSLCLDIDLDEIIHGLDDYSDSEDDYYERYPLRERMY